MPSPKKLEFGNLEHIKKVDKEIKKINSKSYLIDVWIEYRGAIEITAESEKDAINKIEFFPEDYISDLMESVTIVNIEKADG